MNSLEAIVDQYTAKTANLTDFCNIVCNEEMKGEVGELEKEINEVKMLLAECRKIDHCQVMKDMRSALHELRRQEVIMKLVIDRTGSPPRSEQPPSEDYLTPTRPIRNQVPQSSVKKIQWDKRTTSFQPPPPSTGKKSAQGHVSLDHFAYSITEKEFNTIPKYLRGGREQLADLQRCVDEILCPCLIEKYTVINKPNNEMTNVNQRQLKRLFLDQESYFPGHYFITEGDISRFLDTLIDKRLRNRIQMLRQLGLIKEVRKNSTACYMWMIRVEGMEDM